MLVSAIARFQAINAQNRAALGIMRTNNSVMNGLKSTGNSDTNFNALHQQDIKNDTQLAKNQLMYKYATEWKKHCEAKMRAEDAAAKKSLNVVG